MKGTSLPTKIKGKHHFETTKGMNFETDITEKQIYVKKASVYRKYYVKGIGFEIKPTSVHFS